MSTLCWNCRGIGNAVTIHELRNLAKDFAPAILCVVETQVGKKRVEGLTRTLGFHGCYAVDSVGRSGGLGVFWKDSVDFRMLRYSSRHIDGEVYIQGKPPWRLTCIYGEADRSNRHNTWQLMRDIKGESALPWCCIGDYNEILMPEEQVGLGSRSRGEMMAFRDAADVCGLVDLGYTGTDWTWEKKVAGGSYTRV